MNEGNELSVGMDNMTYHQLSNEDFGPLISPKKILELPPLPHGWLWTKLEEVAASKKNAIVDGPFGSNLKNSDYIEDSSGVPVLTTKNLTQGFEKENLRYISHIKFEELKRSEVKSGDILVAKIGSCGKTGIYPQNMPSAIIPANLLKFTVHPTLKNLYVYYFLNSPFFKKELEAIITATAQPAFNVSKFRLLSIPLPPLSEQHRIVAVIEQQFSHLDAGIAALQHAKAKLKRYRAAVLKAAVEGKLTETWRAEHPTTEPAFLLLERILKERRAKWEADLRAKGKDPAKVKYVEPAAPDEKDLPILPKEWCWATPKQLAATGRYSLAIGPFGSNLKVEDYQERGIPLVFVRNIRSTIFDGPDTRYVTVTKADELRAHRVIGGDILITKMGDPPGDACLYPGANSPAIITADCIKWTLSQLLVHRRFFVNAINSSIVRTQILGITQGVAQLKVSLGRFEGIALPLPPLTEQEQIVSEVERRLSVISQLEATIEANLKRAERLRQSILREAFAGRLVPQDPTDEPAGVLLERIQSERNGQKNGAGMNNKKNRSIKVPEPVTLDVGEAEQAELWESVGN